MPDTKKVCNWKEYNTSLKMRGKIIFSFEELHLKKLYYEGKQKKGGIRQYSASMYEYMLTIKVILRLPWRTTEGLVKNLLEIAFPGKEIKVPNYAHASREAGRLDLKIKQYIPATKGGMEIAFDSTGINVYGTSNEHQRKFSIGKLKWMDQWKKVHIAVDLKSMQAISAEYTNSNVKDCKVVSKLAKGIRGKVKDVTADGAYDTKGVYRIIENLGAKAIIPPSVRAMSQDELKKKPEIKHKYLQQRDKAIKKIRRHDDFAKGLKKWKISSGYHKRSLVEAFISRFKGAFGFYFQQRTDRGRRNEMIVKLTTLNLMASFGRAQYVT